MDETGGPPIFGWGAHINSASRGARKFSTWVFHEFITFLGIFSFCRFGFETLLSIFIQREKDRNRRRHARLEQDARQLVHRQFDLNGLKFFLSSFRYKYGKVGLMDLASELSVAPCMLARVLLPYLLNISKQEGAKSNSWRMLTHIFLFNTSDSIPSRAPEHCRQASSALHPTVCWKWYCLLSILRSHPAVSIRELMSSPP